MTSRLKLAYHSLMATIQNARASRASKIMKSAGSSSNYHEKRCEVLRVQISQGYKA